MGTASSEGYSVIIPTMWKVPTFPRFVLRLCESDRVEEVVIIDNLKENAPDFNHPKIVWLKQPQNIFVNPAWNLGVETARCEKLCIANDDIEFDASLFDQIDQYIHSSGIIGLDYRQPDGELSVRRVHDRPFGFGCLMFVAKSRYPKIPDDLKVWCGDDYLFRACQLQGRPNYVIKGAGHEAEEVSMTASTISNELLVQDKANYKNLSRQMALRHPFRMAMILLTRLGRKILRR